MKAFQFNGNLLWAVRIAIAQALIGRNTAAFNLRIENGSVVLSSKRKSALLNVAVVGSEATFRIYETEA